MPTGPGDHRTPRSPVEDVERDPNLSNSRTTGGTDTEEGDSATTTGTGASQEYVGRVAGQDEGFDEETGAEARAAATEGTGDGDVHDGGRTGG